MMDIDFFLKQDIRCKLLKNDNKMLSHEGVGNDVFGGNCVLAGKAVVVRSNRSKFGADFAPPVGQNSLKIVRK